MAQRLLNILDRADGCQSPLISCRELMSALNRRSDTEIIANEIWALDGLRSVSEAQLVGIAASAVSAYRSASLLQQFASRTLSQGDVPAVCVHSGALRRDDLAIPGSFAVALGILASRGLLVDAMDSAHKSPLPLSGSHGLLTPDFDATLRHELRSDYALNPSTTLIAPLTDDPRDVDAFEFCVLAGMLRVGGRDVALILPRAARRIDRAIRHYREGYVRRLLLTDDPIIAAYSAVDIGIAPMHRAATPGDVAVCFDALRNHVKIAVDATTSELMDQSLVLGPATVQIARAYTPAAFAAAAMRLLENDELGSPREANMSPSATRAEISELILFTLTSLARPASTSALTAATGRT